MVKGIKNFISEGKIKEALNLFSDFTSDEKHPLHNDSILLNSRFSIATIEHDRGNKPDSEFNSEVNKINKSLLSFISTTNDNSVLAGNNLLEKVNSQIHNKNPEEQLSLEQQSRNYKEEKNKFELYISKIIELRETYHKFAKFGWDTGKTSSMNNASKEIVELYEEILNKLSSFYPDGHFTENPKTYFKTKISSRYDWHRKVFETYGVGKNGIIVSTMVAGAVMYDMEEMVNNIVIALSTKYNVSLNEWKENWNKK